MSCQAVCNMLQVFYLSHEFRDIRRFEKVLVARRLLFKEITIMPKGKSPKLKGAICIFPVDVADVCNTLPGASDSNGLVIVKFKRKLQYMVMLDFQILSSDYCKVSTA